MKYHNCNNPFLPSCGSEVAPSPAPLPVPVPAPLNIGCRPDKITLRTKIIPANLGDETGAFAPSVGAEYNTIVLYEADGAVVLYDSNGVFTQIKDAAQTQAIADLKNSINALEIEVEFLTADIDELYEPTIPYETVADQAALRALDPSTLPANGFVEVLNDENNDNRPWLYSYNASAAKWEAAKQATPYLTAPQVHALIEALQTNINALANKEHEDVENLQTNINAEVEAREAANASLTTQLNALNQRVEDIVNSPDVRYIVDTYADLEAIDKTTIGDQDYARVLQDETHEDASTYYQFNKSANVWSYVGQTGPYYTKEQIDTKDAAINQQIQGIQDELGNLSDELTALNTGEGV